MGQKQQARSSAHTKVKCTLARSTQHRSGSTAWRSVSASPGSPSASDASFGVARLGRHHQNLVWKSRASFWAFSLQTQVSSRLSPSYDYRAHSPVPLPSSATLPPLPAPTHSACSLTPPPTRHDPSATAPISLPRSTKHKTHGLDIASYLPRLPRYHNGTCFLRFSSCRQ